MKGVFQSVRYGAGLLALVALLGVARADTFPSSESGNFSVDTSAARVDTDGDGMPDNYEISVSLNVLVDDANGDEDGDGISNLNEYNAGSNPRIPDLPQLSQGVSAAFTVATRLVALDSDLDGMPDDWEIANGLDWLTNDTSGDPDGDGLTNLQEYNGGTGPHSNDSPVASTAVSPLFMVDSAVYPYPVTMDSDGDGMPDWWEQKYGLSLLVNDGDTDADSDGVSNLAEFRMGRSPISNESITEVLAVSTAFTLNTGILRLDTDGDGIPDSWELAHGLDWMSNDASADADGDGRSNLEEYNAGTDPQVDDWRGPSTEASPVFLTDTGGFGGPHTRDTDGDGMPDWWEIQYGLNQLLNDSNGDADGDGIINLVEYNSGSNPIVPDAPGVIGVSGIFLVDTGGRSFDTDGDGLPDWWEKLYFNDPRIAAAGIDGDGDGHSNYAEFISGSNPVDAQSVFRISEIQSTRETNGILVVIRWASFDGGTYSIWSAPESQGPYSMITTNIVATPPQNAVTNLVTGPRHFFRVGVSR